ncbi:Chaperone protein DnaK [Diplonema papillatum]|nr:Chaperone protein DnaK [Diplonema papillatum]
MAFRSVAVVGLLLAARLGDAAEKKGGKALGFDVGTDVVRVAAAARGGKRSGMVLNSMSERSFPSAVVWVPAGNGDTERALCENARQTASGTPLTSLRRHVSLDPHRKIPLTPGSDEHYTPQEALAMVLSYAKSFEPQAREDVGLSVPSFFTPRQRQAVIAAASIAGLKPQVLLSEPSALAVAYGALHDFAKAGTKKEPKKDKVLFVLVSAHSVQAAVVKYYVGKGHTASGGRNYAQKVARVMGTAHNATAGSALMQERLLDWIVETRPWAGEEGSGGSRIPARRNASDPSDRVTRRLLQGVRKASEILTSRAEALAEIDKFFEGGDPLRVPVTRATFEAINADVAAAVQQVVADALAAANVAAKNLLSVELYGGGSRVPFIQAAVSRAVPSAPLSHRLDKDEAVAQGIVVAAANYSSPDPATVILLDASTTGFDITVSELSDRGATRKQVRSKKVKPHQPLPARVNVVVNTTASVLEVVVTSQEDESVLGTYTIENIQEEAKLIPGAQAAPAGAPKTVSIRVVMRDSGIVEVAAAKVSVDVIKTVEAKPKKAKKGSKKAQKPKKQTVVETVDKALKVSGTESWRTEKDEIAKAQRKLQLMQILDERRLQVAASKNGLEQLVYDTLSAIGALPDVKDADSKAELEDLRAELYAVDAWLQAADAYTEQTEYISRHLALTRRIEGIKVLQEEEEEEEPYADAEEAGEVEVIPETADGLAGGAPAHEGEKCDGGPGVDLQAALDACREEVKELQRLLQERGED